MECEFSCLRSYLGSVGGYGFSYPPSSRPQKILNINVDINLNTCDDVLHEDVEVNLM